MRTMERPGAVTRRATVTGIAVGLLVLAGCGSSDGSSSATGGSDGAAGATVTVRDAGGMSVLATSSGRTLYLSDQETHKVLCTSQACQAVWMPLTVSSGNKPSAPGTVAGQLTTIKRPDGAAQVAFDGRPLYAFSFDNASGEVNGNGKSDTFDDTSFTWHAATPTGTASAPDSSNPDMSKSPYGNGY